MKRPDPMLQRAILFAAQCHAGQYSKYGIRGQRLPYFVHPVEVMKTVWRWGATDAIVMTAAVLHDILEDSDVTARQVEKKFGPVVTQIVVELTHLPQDGAKQEYLQRFATASTPALVIKLADRYCNLRHRLAAAPRRVPRYFSKSAILRELLQSRQAEIVARFGEEVAAAIALDYRNLEAAVEQIPQDAPR